MRRLRLATLKSWCWRLMVYGAQPAVWALWRLRDFAASLSRTPITACRPMRSPGQGCCTGCGSEPTKKLPLGWFVRALLRSLATPPVILQCSKFKRHTRPPARRLFDAVSVAAGRVLPNHAVRPPAAGQSGDAAYFWFCHCRRHVGHVEVAVAGLVRRPVLALGVSPGA